MKNLLILSFIVVVFILVACSEDKPHAKTYSCQEYSLNCELGKDRILVFPITYDSGFIDACGYQMSDLMKNNQWYILSTKSKGLVPVNIYVCLDYDKDAGCLRSTLTPTPHELLIGVFMYTDISIDTADLSLFVSGLTKAAVVVCGPNEIIFGDFLNPVLATPIDCLY